MRFVSITVFIFCIHVSIALFNATGLFSTSNQPLYEWFSATDNNNLANSSYVQGTLNTNYDLGLGDFVKSLFYFTVSWGLGIVAVPYTLSSFGIYAPLNYILSLPVYLLYMLALAQFVGNRSIRGMS